MRNPNANKLFWTLICVWYVNLAIFFINIEDKLFATIGAVVTTVLLCLSLTGIEFSDRNEE